MRIEGEGRWEYVMRSVGMRDAKDRTLGERLTRMSTWQQSTPAPRLWWALAARVGFALLFVSTLFDDERSVALRLFGGAAALACAAMALRITRVLVAQSRDLAE